MSDFPPYVCTNPSCKSFGKSHPNCACNPPEGHYAVGGAVHHCTHGMSHEPGCEYFADGGEITDNQEFATNPDLSVDHAVLANGLLHTITKTGHTQGGNLLDNSRRGKKAIKHHSETLLDPKAIHHEHDEEKASALENKLAELKANPEKALEIGGEMGDTHPMHSAVLAGKMANAANYLSSIKPHPAQAGPLDKPSKPSHQEERAYKRQVGIAEQPASIYQHIKDGNLTPQDLQTVSALYPKLKSKMADHAFETLAKHKSQGKELTHKQKKQIGMILGEHLSFENSPAAAQAILRANAPMQPPAPPTKKPKKATGVELKQINKVDELSETPLQKLQTARNA